MTEQEYNSTDSFHYTNVSGHLDGCDLTPGQNKILPLHTQKHPFNRRFGKAQNRSESFVDNKHTCWSKIESPIRLTFSP